MRINKNKLRYVLFSFAISTILCALYENQSSGNVVDANAVNADTSIKEENYKAQKTTVDHIKTINLLVDFYKSKEGHTPDNLTSFITSEEPYIKPEASDKMFSDGWGNRLHYYSTGDSYVIASFGRDGVPDAGGSQAAGGWSAFLDFDADIVAINGDWAQSPDNISRY